VHLTTIHGITAQGKRCSVELDDALPAALRRDSVVVHANVALASHGETSTQILGSGSAAQPFAQFELRQLPLTWRAAATPASRPRSRCASATSRGRHARRSTAPHPTSAPTRWPPTPPGACGRASATA
jgi:hypothetical protein